MAFVIQQLMASQRHGWEWIEGYRNGKAFMTQKQKTLSALKRFRKSGITFATFPAGFRLASRIHELLKDGYDIKSTREKCGGCVIARYRLVTH